jgi:hypothetical protein
MITRQMKAKFIPIKMWFLANSILELSPGSTCCSVCERIHGTKPSDPQPYIPDLDASPSTTRTSIFRETHSIDIEKAVFDALTAWRFKVHKDDEQLTGTAFGLLGIMTDRALQIISKSSYELVEIEDFKKLKPCWPLHTMYGNEALRVIKCAREKVAMRWAQYQTAIDKVQKAKEEREKAEKERKAEERLRRKYVTEKKTRDEQRKKRALYDDLVQQGKKPPGRAPKLVPVSPQPGDDLEGPLRKRIKV